MNDWFWSQLKPGPNGCLEWSGKRNYQGYGSLTFDGKGQGAHRVAYFLANDVKPGKMFVLHSCDNPPCCNPRHLRLGTSQDNADDARSRDRRGLNSKYRRGETSGNAKLTRRKVIAARKRRENGEGFEEIARRYGVTNSGIFSAIVGKTWRHIPLKKP